MEKEKKDRIMHRDWDELLLTGILLKIEHDLKEIGDWLEVVIRRYLSH